MQVGLLYCIKAFKAFEGQFFIVSRLRDLELETSDSSRSSDNVRPHLSPWRDEIPVSHTVSKLVHVLELR